MKACVGLELEIDAASSIDDMPVNVGSIKFKFMHVVTASSVFILSISK